MKEEEKMTYQIRCEVSGGMTGYRTSMLKENDAVWETENEEEAKAKAKGLNKKMNSNPYSSASFNYTVEELY
jgi:hypothetical protein